MLRAYVTGLPDATGTAPGGCRTQDSTALRRIDDNLGVRCGDRTNLGPEAGGTVVARRPVGRGDHGLLVLLVAVTAACAGGDEDRIRHQLEDIAQTVSVEARETPMIRQARAARLTTYLTADTNIDLGAPFSPVAGRDAVARAAAQVRVPAGGVTVEFDEVRVTVDDQTRRALATATASVKAAAGVGGELLGVRELTVVLSEIGGEWLIEQVRRSPTSERKACPRPTRL
ncbi:MAG: nuclear transport factor 2 family protein [Vicinamibacterales bacterium]|nr:nuclear transport factor 2 family protein [Vicinamibacterales bacterium]